MCVVLEAGQLSPGTRRPDGRQWRLVEDWPPPPLPKWIADIIRIQHRGYVRTRVRGQALEDVVKPSSPWEKAPSYVGHYAPTLNPRKRIKAIVASVEYAAVGTRNTKLFCAACTLAEIVHEGHLKMWVAVHLLEQACRVNGLRKDDGRERCMATIASAFATVERKLLADNTHDEGPLSHGDDGLTSNDDDNGDRRI